MENAFKRYIRGVILLLWLSLLIPGGLRATTDELPKGANHQLEK